MKKILIILSIITSLNLAYSQTNIYHKFLGKNVEWKGYTSGMQMNMGWCYKYTYYITSFDSMTVGPFLYYTIFTQKEFYAPYYSGPDVGLCNYNGSASLSNYVQGGLREDTILKKVYFLDIDSVNEKLIYDFSLNVGDTLKSSLCPNQPSNIIVTAIDSILIGDNYRKQWTLSGYNYLWNGKMIEGIGSLFGLLEPLANFERSSTLECFSEENINKYSWNNITCPLPVNTKSQLNNEENVIISPNPNKGKITIYQSTKLFPFFEIIDMNGQLILKGDLLTRMQTINLENYAEGMYVVKLIGKEKVEFKKIVVVE